MNIFVGDIVSWQKRFAGGICVGLFLSLFLFAGNVHAQADGDSIPCNLTDSSGATGDGIDEVDCTLGTPGNITDTYAAADQVGYCVSSGNSGSCTANDFLITSIDIFNVDDGCSGPDDYMQVDMVVAFNKATPSRYDITAWFYRGDDTDTLPNAPTIWEYSGTSTQDAEIGNWCTRVSLEPGLEMFNANNGSSVGFTGSDTVSVPADPDNLDGDFCADVPNTPNADIFQTVNDIVLPCRDVGTFITDANNDTSESGVGVPDGIIDIAGCTTWDNNANTVCSGPEYDGVTEPIAGTGAKCNCGNFSGSTVQVDSPDILVTKACSPDVLAPGDVTSCTITITNSGAGNVLGSTGANTEGFFWEDDYPESQGADPGPAVSNVQFSANYSLPQPDPIDPGTNPNASPTSVDGFVSDSSGNATTNQSLNIYPALIPGTVDNSGNPGVLTITYDFETADDLGSSEVTITNRVCARYYDEVGDGSVEVFDYDGVDADLCAEDMVTTPITLSAFNVTSTGSGLAFNWSTATETNNIGFNLYGRMGRTLFKLNDELIPSQAINSLSELSYNYVLETGAVNTYNGFYIEDVDIQGSPQKHGPFKLNKPYGDSTQTSAPADWQAINSENAKFNKGKAKGKNASDKVDILVENAGVQRVTIAELVGLDLSQQALEQGKFILSDREGNSVPVRIVASSSKKANDGFIEFIGESYTSLYTDTNVYQLRTVKGKQRTDAIVSVNGSVQGAFSPSSYYMHTEQVDDDNLYVPSSRLPGDPWLYSALVAFGSNTGSLVVDIPISDVYTGSQVDAEVSANIIGGVDFPDQVDHFVQLYLDGQLVTEGEQDGLDPVEIGQLFPFVLSGNSAQLSLDLVALNNAGFGLVYADSLGITYPRNYVAIDDQLVFSSSDGQYEISGFTVDSVEVYAKTEAQSYYLGAHDVSAGSVSIQGLESDATYYVLPSSGAGTAVARANTAELLENVSANHLVISHPQFMGSELDAYVAQRPVAQGDVTKVVSVEDVYSNFSGGVFDAQAIKSFIDTVSATNNLKSVLLVGGDAFDYKDALGQGAMSFVPSLYGDVSDLIRFAPVDPLYGDVDGDEIPDIPVGRLAVKSAQELTVSLDKLSQFTSSGANNFNALLAADSVDEVNSYNFETASDRAATILESNGYSVDKVYVDQLGINAARTELIDGLNAGPRLAAYSGHTSAARWSFQNLFDKNTASTLTNDSPSAYLQWGCFTAAYQGINSDTLSDRLLFSENGGAAAVVGSTTVIDATNEENYSGLFYQRLVGSGNSIGNAMVISKQQFAQQFGRDKKDILHAITLLGDPLLQID